MFFVLFSLFSFDLTQAQATPVQPPATPVEDRTVDRVLRVGQWRWQGTSDRLDQDVPTPVDGATADAAVGVGVGREERFEIIVGALQWSLQERGFPPVDSACVRRLHWLALHQGRTGWDAAMRLCHKLNKLAHAPTRGGMPPLQRPSAWMAKALDDDEMWTAVEDALRREDQRNVKQPNNQEIRN